MRIEVLVGSEDPVIYPIGLPKISLGSSGSCDIVLSADGISRKHLIVLTEGDQYFVVDQGSTNGTFINEERLVPGRKVEFTSFFPVRLGENVLISLLSDDEGVTSFDIPIPVKTEMSPPASDSTTVISLKDLKNVNTEKLVLQRNQKREVRKTASQQRKTEITKPVKNKNFVPFFAAAIFLTAAVYNFFLKEKPAEEPVAKIGEVTISEDPTKILAEKDKGPNPEVEPSEQLKDEDLIPKDRFFSLMNDIKCTTSNESFFCHSIPGALSAPFGAVQVGLSMHIMIPGEQYYQEAKAFVPYKAATPEEREEYNSLLKQAAAYIFLMTYVPELDQERIKDLVLHFALYRDGETGPYLDQVISFRGPVFGKIKGELQPMTLQYIRDAGAVSLEFTKTMYRTY
jgi:pSer/pThr/pTyr-binding forkhead associated (FHA) protein